MTWMVSVTGTAYMIGDGTDVKAGTETVKALKGSGSETGTGADSGSVTGT